MKAFKRVLAIITLIASITAMLSSAAYANTDGSEIQVTDQPDKLILQLGPQWAGVEFELKTDAGVFPVPVVVDSTGILKMDLGGSKTYTLSCLASPFIVPEPKIESEVTAQSPNTVPDDIPALEAPQNDGVPIGILVVFIIGLFAAVGGLLVMKYNRRRRESYDYSDDDDYE